ncbi:MAG: electron transport complex subunit E [Acholeplasmatales bacterium]|nr:electron transport complex subunit E [Acholeplasmatales bacterium]
MEQTKKGSLKKPFIAGLIAENPVFVSLLGMCPTLATTKSLESAIGMGLLVILTLMGSNVLISLLRKIIPGEVKIPCYIIIIATFVTIIKMATEAFLPELYSSLGVFISLIVVNCIILGRAEAFASKNGPLASFMDALGSGLGFTMAISIIAIIREVLGTGAISVGVYFPIGKAYYLHLFPSEFAISLFVQSAGGFLTLGLVLAFLAWRKNKKDEAKAKLEKERLEALKAQKKAQMEAQAAQAAAKPEVKEAA